MRHCNIQTMICLLHASHDRRPYSIGSLSNADRSLPGTYMVFWKVFTHPNGKPRTDNEPPSNLTATSWGNLALRASQFSNRTPQLWQPIPRCDGRPNPSEPIPTYFHPCESRQKIWTARDAPVPSGITPLCSAANSSCEQETVSWWRKEMCTDAGSRFQAFHVSSKLNKDWAGTPVRKSTKKAATAKRTEIVTPEKSKAFRQSPGCPQTQRPTIKYITWLGGSSLTSQETAGERNVWKFSLRKITDVNL